MVKLKYLLFVLLIAPSVFAQNTTVSGTITDSGGQTWLNGSYQIQFFPGNNQPPFFFNGAPFNSATRFNGVLDGAGHFTQIVPDNNFITPANTQWTFTVCPNANSQCFSTTLKVSGASQNVTSSIIPPPIVVQANSYNQPTAYADSEIQGPTWGFIYFNTSSNVLRQCNGPLPCTWITVSGGGGGSPAPPNLSFQYNNGGVFGGSSLLSTDAGQTTVTDSGILSVLGVLNPNGGINSSTGIVNLLGDLNVCGPNPFVDIRCFGARAATINTTGTGSGTALTVGVSTFQNGDGIVVGQGGAAPTIGTPSSPTVTTGFTVTLTVTDAPVAAAGTATSNYTYTIFASDFAGSITAPAAVTNISNGPPLTPTNCSASLGQTQCTVSTWSLTGNTLTIVTTSPNPFVKDTYIHITGTSGNFNGGGWYPISSITNNTTFVINNVPQFAASTLSGTAGTVTAFLGNQINWTAVTGGSGSSKAWEYFVCAQRPGDASLHIIGTSFPSNGTITGTRFVDYGTTISSSPVLPWWVSDANCTGSAQNAPFKTTVASGGGTTSLTLTVGLTNAVTAQTVRFDNTPTISAAAGAAAASFTGLYIPSGNYVMNSPTILPGNLLISQNGDLTINSTIAIGTGGGTSWRGTYGKNPSGSGPSFTFSVTPTISCSAYPCIYVGPAPGSGAGGGQGLTFDTLTFSAAQNSLLVFLDGNWGTTFEKVNFASGSGSNDNFSMGLVARPGNVNLDLKNVLFSGGPGQVIDQSWTPLFYAPQTSFAGLTQVGPITIRNSMWNRRGFLEMAAGGSGFFLEVDNAYRQGGITPFFVAQNTNGNLGGSIKLDFIAHDTESQAGYAWICNLSCTAGGGPSVRYGFTNQVSTDAGTRPGQITGGGNTGITNWIAAYSPGDNFNAVGLQFGNGAVQPTVDINLNGHNLVNGQGLNFKFLDGVGNGSTLQSQSPLGANFNAFLPAANGQICVEGLAACFSIADAGTANTYSGCPVPALTSYSTPFTFELSGVLNANTGPSTVNLCSLGAKTIKKNGGTVAVGADLASNDFKIGGAYILYFDGTNMNVLSQLGNISGGGTVGITGSPVNGNLTKWSSGTTITNADLTGDVTTSGTSATTVTQIKGVPINCVSASVGQLLTVISGPQYQCIYPGVNYNAQTGDYTLACPTPDRLGYVDFVGTDTLNHVFTLPQAGSTACLQSSVSFIVANHSNRSETATPVTLTLKATASTIDGITGSVGIVLTAGETRFVYSDAVSGVGNYHTTEIPASDGGINVQTTSYTAVLSDWNKTVIMNCSGACTFTVPSPPPVAKWKTNVMSIGSTLATVSLNSLNFNVSASVPVLNSFQAQEFRTDGTNYFGSAPLVASTNVTFTPSSNGLAISASGGGGGGATLQTNGVNNASQATLNFQNSAAGASQINFSNPSGGNEQAVVANIQGTDTKLVSGGTLTANQPMVVDSNSGASSLSLSPTTLTDGATVTWAIASAFEANASLTFTVHGGSRTLNITGPFTGGTYLLRLIQDATGGEGLVLGSGCTWKVINGGAGAITLSNGANAQDVLTFYFDGTNCYANLGRNYN